MRVSQLAMASGLALAAALASCTDDRGGVDECVPNDTQLCNCPDGSEGVQTCTADGAWSACECGDGGADSDVDSDADGDTDTNDTLEEGCNKMDILFVIDNSDSMSEEQDNLIASFPAFIERIEAYDVIGTDEPLDYHVGVISTEVDHNAAEEAGNNRHPVTLIKAIALEALGEALRSRRRTAPTASPDQVVFEAPD